jgi:hypothetical protein
VKKAFACGHVGEKTETRCPICQPEPPAGRNAQGWPTRDRAEQARFRRRVLEAAGYTCTRCGLHDPTGKALDAHHLTPTTGQCLCNRFGNGCHAAVDKHAR